MTCPLIADETVQRYLDRDLSSGEAEAFEEHVPGCHLCQESLAEVRSLYVGLSALPVWEPSPAFTGAVMEAVWPLHTPGLLRRSWLALRRWPAAVQGLAAAAGLASVGFSAWFLPRLLKGAVTVLPTGAGQAIGETARILADGVLGLYRLSEDAVHIATLSYFGKLLTVGRVLADAAGTVALSPAGAGLLAVMILLSGSLIYLVTQLRTPKRGYQHVRILA